MSREPTATGRAGRGGLYAAHGPQNRVGCALSAACCCTFVGYFSLRNMPSSASSMKCSLRKSKEMMGLPSCTTSAQVAGQPGRHKPHINQQNALQAYLRKAASCKMCCAAPDPQQGARCKLPCQLSALSAASLRLTVILPCSGTISRVPTNECGTTLTCVASSNRPTARKCSRLLMPTLHTVPR